MYKNSQSKKQSFRICLFMKIGWRWTCSQIFSKFRRLENLRLFWMILSTTFAQLMTLSKNNNIIYTRKSFPTNFYLFKANYRSTEKVKIIQSYQQETLRIVTISIIFSTLASLWKFQYFRRPIYNRVKHLWCSFYCENSKPLSIFSKKNSIAVARFRSKYTSAFWRFSKLFYIIRLLKSVISLKYFTSFDSSNMLLNI